MAKKIGCTIGRYHPFHKGHTAIIEKLSKEYDKVYVFVAGNKSSKKNPYPFQFRRRLINMSLSVSNVQFLMATKMDDDGHIKQIGGFLPDLIKRLRIGKQDTLHILVGRDRYAGFKAQLDTYKSEFPIDTKRIEVKQMGNVQVDTDSSGRISGTEVRSLIVGNNKEETRKRMSSKISYKDFEAVWDKLRFYLGKYYRLHESKFFLNESVENLATLKGIAHLEDMNPLAFLKFLQKWHNMEIDGGMEISEKVDGSAQMSFGATGNGVYAKSKYGKPLMSPSGWPSTYMYDALRNSHYAIDSVKNKIKMLQLVPNRKNPDGYDIVVSKKKIKGSIYPQFFVEVLWTRFPNSLEYGDNILMIYSAKVEGKHVASSTFERDVIKKLIELTGKKTVAKGAKWRFEDKIILSKNQFEINTRVEYKKVSDILADLKTQEILLKRAKTKEEKKAQAHVLKKIRKIQIALKQKFLDKLRSTAPVYGGDTIEGIVIKDMESGAMIKVVDKNVFTAINSYFWHYRELLGKGLKVGDEWKVGIGTQLKYDIAETVFGVPAFKTPSAPTYIKNRISKYKSPTELTSPNSQFNWKLYRFLDEHTAVGKKKASAMQADFLKAVSTSLRATQRLKKEWEVTKKKNLSKSIEDEKGKVIRTVTLPPEVITRTDKAFDLTIKELEQLLSRVQRFVSRVKTPEAKKVIMLKIFLGPKQLAKIE
jgi:cytidyltransferase-like protein